MNFFSLEEDLELGRQTYAEILASEQLVVSGPTYQMVNRVMDRLVVSARVDEPEIVDAFEWEVNLIANDQMINAFALPGGKMAVYTGILPVAQTEAGLAVVMGHEIAHVIERHGTEAMTKQLGYAVIIELLFEGDSKDLAYLANALLQLKYGRGAELEADAMGLIYMARAGYDPRTARGFWMRMTEAGGEAPPEFFSTHPSGERRIDQIEDQLSEAIPIYEASQAAQGR